MYGGECFITYKFNGFTVGSPNQVATLSHLLTSVISFQSCKKAAGTTREEGLPCVRSLRKVSTFSQQITTDQC